MPLSEINSETPASHRDTDPSAMPYADWRTWPEAVYRLWSQRRRILRWVLLGMLLSVLLSLAGAAAGVKAFQKGQEP